MTTSANARYQALLAVLENAVDAIVSIDEHGRIQTFNPAAERVFLHAADSVLGENVSILMPEPHRSHHDGYVARYVRTGERHIIGVGRQVECLRADGTRFPADISVSESGSGAERLFTAIIRDVSETRALRRVETEHAITLEYAPIGIVTLDMRGRLLSMNRAASRMTGFSAGETLGVAGVGLLHIDDQSVVRQMFADLLQGKAEHSTSTHRIRTSWGTYLPVRTYNAVVRNRAGRVSKLICMFQDLTEQHAAESEIQTQRERLAHVARLNTMGEMAVGLAHELNQPLAAISTYAQAGQRMAARSDADLGELRSAFQRIDHQARRAGEVIQKIREMTRQTRSGRTRVDVNELIDDLMTLMEIDARHADVKVKLDRGDVPAVSADPVQIEQVLLNFVRNAIDAIRDADSEDREIVIHTGTTDGGRVEVSVADRGPGVDSSVASRLFDPFMTTKTGGMGMGLTISHTIISAHDGTIGFTPNEGGGAIFWFTLPAGADEVDE